MDFSVGDLVDLHGFYDMLMDVMRFSVGFFLHDFHDFAAQAKVSYWKTHSDLHAPPCTFCCQRSLSSATSASATHPVQERKLSCWRLEHMPFLTEHPVEPKKTGEISWNTMIVIWTIEFTNGSFTKMELYGSKIRVGSVRKWGLPPNNHFNRENDDQPPMDLCCCFHILRQSHIFWFQARKSSNRLAAGEWFINPNGARLRSGLSRHIPTTYYLS